MTTEFIDWQALERKRIAEERQALQQAIGELQQSVALLADLERTESWKHICELLRNTANAKQAEAMKAGDPTTLARAFGYMAACLDVCQLPSSRAQQLQAQSQQLQSQLANSAT
jgi:hypothetical protein